MHHSGQNPPARACEASQGGPRWTRSACPCAGKALG
jgi:hypothetical protein